tara:strand:- start:24 stop:233 length:210 start_codon:yes stop_codon:yes gene_type:complete
MNNEDTKKAMLIELSKYTEIPKDKEEDVLNLLFSAFKEVVEDLEAKRLEEFDRATDDAIRDRLETEGVV